MLWMCLLFAPGADDPTSDLLVAIVEDLLALARLEEPETSRTLKREDAAMAELLATVAAESEHAAGDRRIRLVVDAPPDVVAPVNRHLIEQAVSNLVSNVPATMLLLPSATHPLAGPILALSSTLAGNLIIVGSIANIIVVDQAERVGVRITWREHAAIGVPVTLATLAICAAWLWVLAAAMPQ